MRRNYVEWRGRRINDTRRLAESEMEKMKGVIEIEPGKILNNWNCIKGFAVADSKKDKALQFADILASSVYFMLLSKRSGNKLNSYEQYIEILLQDIANNEQYWEI